MSSNSTHFDECRCRSRGSGLARRLTDPAYNLVLGASLLLPFARMGGFGGGDALALGAVGAWRGWQFVMWTAWWAALAGTVLAGGDLQAEDLAVLVVFHAGRDEGMHAHHAAAFAHLQDEGVADFLQSLEGLDR